MSDRKRKVIDLGIDDLFAEPQVSTEILRDYLTQLHSNLLKAERLLSRIYFYIVLIFLAFLFLDTGLINTIKFHGTELERTGLVMVLFPALIAFLYYRAMAMLDFIHEIRTAISLIYRKMKETFYTHCLDLLTQYPSIRNLETFQGVLANGQKIRRKVLIVTTTTVSLFLGLAPIVILGYSLYRTWFYIDLPRWIWILITVISSTLTVRALFLGGSPRYADPFSERKGISNDNEF